MNISSVSHMGGKYHSFLSYTHRCLWYSPELWFFWCNHSAEYISFRWYENTSAKSQCSWSARADEEFCCNQHWPDIPVLFNYKNYRLSMVKKGLPDILVNWFLDAVICPAEMHFGRWTEQSWNDMRMIWKNWILPNLEWYFSDCQSWKAVTFKIEILET